MKIVKTGDHSPTIYSSQFDQTYHSLHGALSESEHVFMENGVKTISGRDRISVFEMGYGTGINAMLTYLYAKEQGINLRYESIEKYPLTREIYDRLKIESTESSEILNILNNFSWNEWHSLDNFQFIKWNRDILELDTKQRFDIIFYDAFSPGAQPELWTELMFKKMYDILNPGGILTTYCAKGEVKRNLKASGFEVQARPGPKGKREMTYAVKGTMNTTNKPAALQGDDE